MPYTTSEQIRTYLFTNSPVSRQIANQPVPIDTNEVITFFGGSATPGSLVVKSVKSRELERMRVTAGTSVIFSASPVVSGSVVVANNSSLGTVYAETIDYIIDYAAGAISVVSSGNIEPGTSITIWYQPYVVYTEGADYSVNLDRGEIRRLASGSIALGETIYLDYMPQYLSATDQVIASAVTAANGIIERTIDPAGEFEADPILAMAASFKALEIICRAAASRDLSYLPGQDRSAKVWIQLAAEYATRADDLLSSFRPPVTPLAPPTLS